MLSLEFGQTLLLSFGRMGSNRDIPRSLLEQVCCIRKAHSMLFGTLFFYLKTSSVSVPYLLLNFLDFTYLGGREIRYRIENGKNTTYKPAANISHVATTPVGDLNLMFNVCMKKPSDISIYSSTNVLTGAFQKKSDHVTASFLPKYFTFLKRFFIQ